MKKGNLINIIIILIILVFAAWFILKPKAPNNQTTEELAKCIGSKSELYIQLGCHYCDQQEAMFGNNTQYLNKIDCFYEREKCTNIGGTPTWVINGQTYEGLQTIEKLKELTGC